MLGLNGVPVECPTAASGPDGKLAAAPLLPLLPTEGVASLVWTPEVVAQWGGEDKWLGVVWGDVGDREEAEEEAVQGPEEWPTWFRMPEEEKEVWGEEEEEEEKGGSPLGPAECEPWPFWSP